MFTACIFATSQYSAFPFAPKFCSGNAREEAAAKNKTSPSKRHLLTSTISVLLLLSGASSVLVFGQTESPARPQRTQSTSSLQEEDDLSRLRLKPGPKRKGFTKQALSTVSQVYTGKQLPPLSKR